MFGLASAAMGWQAVGLGSSDTYGSSIHAYLSRVLWAAWFLGHEYLPDESKSEGGPCCCTQILEMVAPTDRPGETPESFVTVYGGTHQLEAFHHVVKRKRCLGCFPLEDSQALGQLEALNIVSRGQCTYSIVLGVLSSKIQVSGLQHGVQNQS